MDQGSLINGLFEVFRIVYPLADIFFFIMIIIPVICNFSSKRKEYLQKNMTKIIKNYEIEWDNYQTRKKRKRITNVSTPAQESLTCTSFLYSTNYSEHTDNRD